MSAKSEVKIDPKPIELKRHTKAVQACVFHEKFVFTVSTDRTIAKWGVDGSFIQELTGHVQRVSSCACCTAGYLLTGSFDKTAKIWNITTGAEMVTVEGHSHFINCVAISPDSKYMLTGSADMAMRLYSVSETLAATSRSSTSEHSAMVISVCYSPKAHILASGSWDRLAKLFNDSREEMAVFSGHPKRVNAVALNPDGTLLISSSSDNTSKIWEIKTKQEIITLKGHTQPVFSCAISHDGRYAVTGSVDGSARIWLLANGQQVGILEGHKGWISSIDMSPGSTLIATASKDTTVKVWNSQSGETLSTLQGHTAGLLGCRFSPDGRMIVSCGEDHTVRVWDVASFSHLRTLLGHTHEVSSVCFFADNPCLVASAAADKTIRIWDIFAGKELLAFYLPTALSSMNTMCTKPFKEYLTGEPLPAVTGDCVGNLHWVAIKNLKNIPILQFSEVELRIGKIVSIRRVPNSDKLYVEDVDMGPSLPRRQIVSAIVEYIPIEELRNRLVVVTCNIKPISVKGVTSSGKLTGIEILQDGKDVFELLDVPAAAALGERLLLPGCIMAPPAALVPYESVEEVYHGMYADSMCGVQFHGIPLICNAGKVTIRTLTGGRGC